MPHIDEAAVQPLKFGRRSCDAQRSQDDINSWPAKAKENFYPHVYSPSLA